MKSIFALALSDIKITARRGEALLLSLVIPLGALIYLSERSTNANKATPIAYLLTVAATSLTSLGIATGFDRRYRVLVRLGTTPLGRRGLVYSKIISLIVSQTVQLVILSVVALFLGWNIRAQWILALPLCWLSSCAFAGIALFLAGHLKAEVNLAVQNLVYIVIIGLSGVGLTIAELSPATRDIIHIIPSGALLSLLRSLMGQERFSPLALISLIVEAVVLPLLAARKFSFDE